MIPLWTPTTFPSSEVCGWAFVSEGSPWVAQRVWPIPQVPARAWPWSVFSANAFRLRTTHSSYCCSFTLLKVLIYNFALKYVWNTRLWFWGTILKGSAFSNSDWDFTCFKRFNNCYILLLNSPQTLENTEFITGELSLIVSLVLYCPTSVYELW